MRETKPKDIKQEFLTGPRKFDEIMEKLEIIVNEMMADHGPVPMDLGNVGTHDAKMTQSDSDTNNDMSLGKGAKQAREQARHDRTAWVCGIVEKELMNGRVSMGTMVERREAREAPRAISLMGTVTKTKDPVETKAKGRAKARARAKLDIATFAESKGKSELTAHTSGPTA